MRKIVIRLLSLVYLAGALGACEYDLNQINFVNLNKPSEAQQFDLSVIPSGDTIKVFSNTQITYNLNTYGKQISEGRFTVGSKTWNVYSTQGDITLYPNDMSPGYYKLTLELYAKTNTGSLADYFGAERYVAKREWTVVFDNREAPMLPLSKSITPEGYLKISWPKCDQYNFRSYNFSGYYNSNSISKTIYNANQNYYIDSTYVGEGASFHLSTSATGQFNSMLSALDFNDSVPQLHFESIGLDKLRIYWYKSPYKVFYSLMTTGNTELFRSVTDTSYTIDHPGFATSKDFTLYTVVARKTNFTTSDYQYFRYSTKSYVLGTRILGNWPDYGYNPVDKVVYSNTYDAIEEYDVSTGQNIRNLSIYQLMYQGLYSCPTNSTKVAALSSEYIYVFNDKSLQNPVKIPYSCMSKSIDHFYLTDNDIIAIATPNSYQQIRISDQKVLVTIPISDYPYYSKWACFSTSSDSKYFCVVTANGTKLYKIENGVTENIYSDSRDCTSVLFDPYHPEQFYIVPYKTNMVELRRASDFQLLKSYTMPSSLNVLENIDPETGFLLTTDYKKLYLLDPAQSKIVFQIPSGDYKTYIYSNKLFGVYGRYLDISKYITK